MAICPVSENAGIVPGLVGTVDCHIRVLVQDTYLALVGPNTMFGAAFTGLLTIYVALVGVQLMLGRGGLRVLDLPAAALKIGLIMAVVTSWAAYQTLVFNLLFDGPRDVLHALLGPILGPGRFDGDLYSGLEFAYQDLSSAAAVYGSQASPSANILQGGPMLASGLLWLAAIAMLFTTIGIVLAAKIVLAFLLAVGPIFIGLSLFETTRGLFEGWVRAAITFALAPLAANVFGAAMLLMLAPFLDALALNVQADSFDMGPIVTIAIVVAVFALVMAMAVRACATVAAGFGMRRAPQMLNAPPRPAPDLLAFASRGERPDDASRAALASAPNVAAAALIVRDAPLLDAAGGARAGETERIGQSYRRTPVMLKDRDAGS